MDDQGTDRASGGGLSKARQPHWSRFSLKALLVFVLLLSVAIIAFQFGYQMGRTVSVLELIDQGWIPPKPQKK
jgi:hypothetical protein